MTKTKRINNLNSISGLTAQMRSVYRAARINTPDDAIDAQQAKILVDMLKTITAAMRDSELEARIDKLEKQND